MNVVKMKLAYSGSEADNHQLDFYDIGKALIGFQRSLALTTHLVLNNEIITQAPSLKGATIRAAPTSAGSWEILVLITLLGVKAGTLPKDTPLGHLIYSVYDYVVKGILGVHVDYEKSLLQSYREANQEPLSSDHVDQLIERCESPIRNMHRPIVGEKTAEQASMEMIVGQRVVPIAIPLNGATYEHIALTLRSDSPVPVRGRISSYNTQSFKGRAFVQEFGHPVPFELIEKARDNRIVQLVTDSLAAQALNPRDEREGYVDLRSYVLTSKAGRLKRLEVVNVFRA